MLREDIELCNASDPSDPDYGEPAAWPLWCDRDTYELGPTGLPGEDPLPGEWALTSEQDLEDLRHWKRFEPFEPSPEDCDLLLDLEERRSYERGCNAHWIE
ncbi:MAG TPA: hypothetical protein VJY33_22175 [Isosphaeraceae bacterium]|nr:hypothetical protein [Isosphaeraceae bacterium]